MTSPRALATSQLTGPDPDNPYGLPAQYTDAALEYAALRGGAVVIDRGARGRMTLGGGKAREVLTGLVTNDVGALAPGHGQYAAALSAKGKIIADLRVYARGDDLLLDVPPLAWAGFTDMIRKYVNPRLASYVDRSPSLGQLGVYGTRAASVVAGALGAPLDRLESLAAYAHVRGADAWEGVMAARVPDAGVDGFELYVPAADVAALRERLIASGATPAGAVAANLVRIEAGRPEWGVDIDGSTLAQEANMDELHAISYTKGCYTGQETVARVHFRGHVNRQLRGLRFDAALGVPRGAEVQDAEGRAVGDVRSVGDSPRLGGVALAMVRREVAPEAGVVLSWGGASGPATVVALPFPAG
jgi:folate-binding protein YgfZ